MLEKTLSDGRRAYQIGIKEINSSKKLISNAQEHT